ncbi:hypothetical protein [Ferrimonas marina]|uniref:Flagellin n=1 Tax=Ferrimonas marina TaxID=299255 RepID=A0A1M5QYU6_9GAMM|nr:hypothetical protein [Ferrimonas marina]SHH19347.1 hypothetical protein SAMN02745129_1422 [Ferrimonas marina]
MVAAVSDPLSIQQRNTSQPTAPSQGQGALAASKKGKGKGVALPQWRLESYRRWAQVGQGQHQVAAAQTGAQALRQAKGQLESLQREVNTALRRGNGNPQSMAAKRDRVVEQNASYRGQPLLDRQMNLVTRPNAQAPRQFQLKGVDLAATKEQAEQVSLQLGKEKTQLELPAGVDRAKLAQILNDGLSGIGLGARLGQDGQVMLMLNEQQAQLLDGGLWMSGQGARLPAGQAIAIKTEEAMPWQDPREWQFDNQAQLRQSQAKLRKTLDKVDAQLAQLESVQHNVASRLAKVNRNSQASAQQVAEASQQLQQAMNQAPFRAQVSSLLAQANLSRTQVTDLLRG